MVGWDGISILLGKLNRAIVTTVIPVVFVLAATFFNLVDLTEADYQFPEILGGPAIAADIAVRESDTVVAAAETPEENPAPEADLVIFGNAVSAFPEPLYPDGSATVMAYEIKSGDTLSGIAKRFGVTLETIIAANSGLEARSIRPGDLVKVPTVSGVIHELRGETVESVAALYGVSVQAILEANPDLNSATLVIPGATEKKKSERAQTTVDQVSFMAPTNGLNWGTLHANNAVDFANRCGEMVFVSADGVVGEAKTGWNQGYGNMVRIDHTGGVSTIYAHLQDIFVSAGDLLVQGDRLGTVGRTGNVVATHPAGSGCHVHFEVRGTANPFVKE